MTRQPRLHVMAIALLMTLFVPAGALAARATPSAGLTQRVAALEALLSCVSVNTTDTINGLAPPHIFFTGCNVHVRSGSGLTDDNTTEILGGDGTGELTGLGNLIVGYNEPKVFPPDSDPDITEREGSHNLIVGAMHKYSNAGGFVAGFLNTVSGAFSSVSGGWFNTAVGPVSSVSGGNFNTASEQGSSVSGGSENEASGFDSSVSGGRRNEAIGNKSSVSGGAGCTLSGDIEWGATLHDNTDVGDCIDP